MRVEFNTFRDTYNELMSDVEIAKELDSELYSEDFIKRTYTRAFFALVEGVVSQLKKIALAANEQVKIFQDFEVALLNERSGFLASNGVAKESKAMLEFMPNIVFSLNYSAKALGLNYTVKKEGGYQSMLDAIKIRDRITHPKGKSCVVIGNDEMNTLADANAWFRHEVVRLMKLIRENHEVV
ncbi:MAG: hypothetical protein ISS70_08755 [Phycisphaerae bacterium]|nr:hypothetical protein [Phycisphaerae bacterium]